MALAPPSGEKVPAALQQQRALLVEADRGVGPVEFLLDDDVASADLRIRNLIEILVAGLQLRALEMPRPRILDELARSRHGSPAMRMAWSWT